MSSNENIFVLLITVSVGLITFLSIFLLMRRKGKKERWFDERYSNIHRYGRSFSWLATTFAILLAWIIIIYFEGASLAFFVMTGIWVVHMLSYLVGTMIANTKF